MKKYLFLLFILFSTWIHSQSWNNPEINNAYIQQNISWLIRNINDQNQKEIEDILFTKIDYKEYTYEQILGFLELCNSNKAISSEFNRIRKEKAIEIIEYISQLTVEQLVKYSEHFKQRKPIINSYIQTLIYSNLNAFSYLELSYLERKSDFSFMEEIKLVKNNKKGEISHIFKNEIETYCNTEKEQLEKLFYILKYRSLEYIHMVFRDIAQSYSKVELPEYPNQMVDQFNNIMNSHLNCNDLNDILQQEVNNYCDRINTARSFYLREIGYSGIIKLKIQTPIFRSFSYRYNISPFQRIADLRNELIESQETTSAWSGVIGLFTSWAGVGKALLDMGSITDEAKEEVQLRKEYMYTIIHSLEKDALNYLDKTESNIKNDYNINQKKFKEYALTNF